MPYGRIIPNMLQTYGQLQTLKDLKRQRKMEDERHQAYQRVMGAQTNHYRMLMHRAIKEEGAAEAAAHTRRSIGEVESLLASIERPEMDDAQFQVWRGQNPELADAIGMDVNREGAVDVLRRKIALMKGTYSDTFGPLSAPDAALVRQRDAAAALAEARRGQVGVTPPADEALIRQREAAAALYDARRGQLGRDADGISEEESAAFLAEVARRATDLSKTEIAGILHELGLSGNSKLAEWARHWSSNPDALAQILGGVAAPAPAPAGRLQDLSDDEFTRLYGG